MLLKQKTAIITGCNRGIGKVILEKFAENGADIFACVRKESNEFIDLMKKLAEKVEQDMMAQLKSSKKSVTKPLKLLSL